MNHLIYRTGELIRDTFVVVSNDGASRVTNLTNESFTKFLFEDGVQDEDILVEVSHRGEGVYLVLWSTQAVGIYDLLMEYTVSGVIRRLHWGSMHVEPFGDKNLLHYGFGDHVKQVGAPNLFKIRDFGGQTIAEYEVTDVGRVRIT